MDRYWKITPVPKPHHLHTTYPDRMTLEEAQGKAKSILNTTPTVDRVLITRIEERHEETVRR